MEAVKARISIPAGVDAASLAGSEDTNLRVLEKSSGARIVLRGDRIIVEGSAADVDALARVFSSLFSSIREGERPSAEDTSRLFDSIRRSGSRSECMPSDVLLVYHGHSIRPKTLGQRRYIDAIRNHTMTFCLGPAGTGKTYLAMAMAVAALQRHDIGRIVLTRPVVEAGENLGFLPGTLEDKVDPYVRPLFDALFDMMDSERAAQLVDRGVIEIAPLAYMRGRTLNDAFVILDEAQNTTPEQMKMFLTRLGYNSRFVITGDASQRDLRGRFGGLDRIEQVLGGIEDIAFIHLGSTDVVRHSLVGKIVEAYDAFDAHEEAHGNSRKGVRHERSHQ